MVHRELELAQAALASGRAYLYQIFDELYDKAVAGKSMTMDDKANAQLASTNAIQVSARFRVLSTSIRNYGDVFRERTQRRKGAETQREEM